MGEARPENLVSRIAAIVAVGVGMLAITSCSRVFQAIDCPDVHGVSDQELVEWVVKGIVGRSHSPIADLVIYDSTSDFYRRNPSCCYISKPKRYSGGTINLSWIDQVEVTVRYREQSKGPEPYTLAYTEFGACPSDRETFSERLTEEQHRESERWRLGWKVR
jgi:hypothetical protein